MVVNLHTDYLYPVPTSRCAMISSYPGFSVQPPRGYAETIQVANCTSDFDAGPDSASFDAGLVIASFDAGLVSASGEMQAPRFAEWAGSSRTTLAIVFTDIVGATALAHEMGNEAMSRVLRAHFRQARQQVGEHEGFEIKTIGDSFMVAFHTAFKAFNFALALQASTGHNQVKIRAGIHVGPVQIEEDDAQGSMVNYAARVQGQAKGAEIWLSDRAKSDIDEEQGTAPGSLSWEEHADLELKGFPDKQKLWSVLVPSAKLSIRAWSTAGNR